jgi:hypothetical protein
VNVSARVGRTSLLYADLGYTNLPLMYHEPRIVNVLTKWAKSSLLYADLGTDLPMKQHEPGSISVNFLMYVLDQFTEIA